MNGIYLIIGGNMGAREKYIGTCIQEIEKSIGKVCRKSAIYETASWGNKEQNPFLNQVLFIRSNDGAETLLMKCLAIEKKMGRTREIKWASRIIDIDILFFNHEIVRQEKLSIPHPLLQERRFVLIPLNEIAPMFTHPVLNKTIHTLLKECTDPLQVTKLLN